MLKYWVRSWRALGESGRWVISSESVGG